MHIFCGVPDFALGTGGGGALLTKQVRTALPKGKEASRYVAYCMYFVIVRITAFNVPWGGGL